jgi:hypothetical protein
MKLKTFLTLIIIHGTIMAQEFDISNYLYYNHEIFKEVSLSKRRIKYNDILPLIDNLKHHSRFWVSKIGESSLGRDIFLIRLGTGDTKVFLWSQMHGDESTATMALFDIFNFFSKSNDYNWLREKLLEKITFYFIPMLNPDGAERFQRRTELGIDINRDALKLETPEAKILMNSFNSIHAHFGFNLHDQSPRYSTGNSNKPPSISFLAPAFDSNKTVNQTRENAIKLISKMIIILNHYIPGHISKYSDEFEPRAFGDLFQSLGMSTILVESGGWKNDNEKQFIRKLNFIGLLTAFYSIAEESYKTAPKSVYDNLPFNENYIFDLLLRNVIMKKNGKNIKIDVAINFSEVNTESSAGYYFKSKIEDIGDLSNYYGINDYDFTGYTIEEGKTFKEKIKSLEQIGKLNFQKLHSNGFTNVLLDVYSINEIFSKHPINICLKNCHVEKLRFKLDNPANLILKKGNKIKYVIINGSLISVDKSIGNVVNGLILK